MNACIEFLKAFIPRILHLQIAAITAVAVDFKFDNPMYSFMSNITPIGYHNVPYLPLRINLIFTNRFCEDAVAEPEITRILRWSDLINRA